MHDDVRPTIRRFADWCAIHADEEPDDSYYDDYLNNYEVIVDDGYFVLIDVRLGAFDHGAGNAYLIMMGNKQWVAYEDEVTLFAEGSILKNTQQPIDPPDDQAHHNH